MAQSPSSPPLDPTPAWSTGTWVEDRFQILRELGRGGMGAVYLVFDRELCRELALKRIHPQGVGNEDHEQRFRREYRALASIHDPGVPQVYHSGRAADGAAWFTMEAIRGESLRTILERDTLGAARALDLAIRLGKILAAAHAAGVIHRDVKPANVMVEPGDRVRLLDFGVCTPMPRFLRAAEPRRRTAHVDRWDSGENNFAGTIGYSDPATHDGTPATVRSDIYSLAVITYEMLTGRRHCDPDSLVYRPIDSAEFPLALAGLAEDLRRALAHNLFERHRSMPELVQRLEIARGLLARAEAEAGQGRQRSRLTPLLTFVLGTGCAAILVAARGTGDADAQRGSVPGRPETAGPPHTADLPVAALPPAAAAAPLAAPAAELAAASLDASVPTSSPTASPTGPRAPDTGRTRRKLARLSPQIARCVKDFGSSLNTRIPVRLVLDPSGHVEATVPAAGRDMFATCVAATLRTLSFAPGTPSPISHTFDLTRP